MAVFAKTVKSYEFEQLFYKEYTTASSPTIENSIDVSNYEVIEIYVREDDSTEGAVDNDKIMVLPAGMSGQSYANLLRLGEVTSCVTFNNQKTTRVVLKDYGHNSIGVYLRETPSLGNVAITIVGKKLISE